MKNIISYSKRRHIIKQNSAKNKKKKLKNVCLAFLLPLMKANFSDILERHRAIIKLKREIIKKVSIRETLFHQLKDLP